MRHPALHGLIIALLGLSVSSGIAFAGPLQDAQAAYNLGDYATALRLWQPLGTQGSALAQNKLGWMYQNGIGVPQDNLTTKNSFRADAGRALILINAAADAGLDNQSSWGIR
jgi:TPR repeat protein